MRISTTQLTQRGADAILERQASASKVQLQLSTGKRMLTPADDPSASAAVVSLNQSLASMEQYQRNGDFALSRLNQEESALVSIEVVLQRIRELTLQGSNATQTVETRNSIADEMDLLLTDLLALANTKDATNSYLFAGYQDKNQPFTENPDGSFSYLGDDGLRMVQISDTQQVATHDSGNDVFMDVASGNRTFEVAGNSNNRGTGVIDPGWVTNPQNYDRDTYSVIFPVQTTATDTLTFNDVVGNDDTLQYSLTINGTTVYSVDEASTAVATLDGLAAAINDDFTTTGVRAYVESGNLYLAAAPGTASIDITESVAGFTAGDGDEVTGYFGSVLNADTTTSSTTSYVLDPEASQASPTLTFSDVVGTDDNIRYTLSIENHGVYAVDEAGTPVASLDALAQAINDDTDRTGITAIVQGNRIHLEGPSTLTNIDIRETISNYTGGDGDSITGYFGTQLNGDTNISATKTFIHPTANRFLVVDSQFNVETAGTYEEGARIDFAGLYTNVKGQPNVGDVFTVTPSVRQDVFTTVRNLSNAIRSGGTTEAARAQFHNTINRELTNLDRGKDKVDEVRASVGARLRTLEVQADLNIEFSISVQERRSELEDLDFVEAINRFNIERTALEAAQQAYVRMQGMNLFSLL